MNVNTARLLDFLMTTQGKKAEEALAAEDAKRRKSLAAELQKLDSECLAKTRKLTAQRDDLDAKASALRKQLLTIESEANDVAFALSVEHSAWADKRDVIWNQLRELPCRSLVSFREEIDKLLMNSGALICTWDRPGSTQIPRPKDSNQLDVEAYQQALLRSRDDIAAAIRTGLDGEEAEAAIERIRRSWPRVRQSA